MGKNLFYRSVAESQTHIEFYNQGEEAGCEIRGSVQCHHHQILQLSSLGLLPDHELLKREYTRITGRRHWATRGKNLYYITRYTYRGPQNLSPSQLPIRDHMDRNPQNRVCVGPFLLPYASPISAELWRGLTLDDGSWVEAAILLAPVSGDPRPFRKKAHRRGFYINDLCGRKYRQLV